MIPDLEKSHELAQRCLGTTETLQRLGWGVSGFVYLSADKQSAVKVHLREEAFEREVYVYKRLKTLRLTELYGLKIPKYWKSWPLSRTIQMDFITPPYLLDFAGVLLDPPDFSEDAMDDWHRRVEKMFGRNTDIVWAVYNALKRYDLYYIDFRPSNLNTTGLQGAEPSGSTDDDF